MSSWRAFWVVIGCLVLLGATNYLLAGDKKLPPVAEDNDQALVLLGGVSHGNVFDADVESVRLQYQHKLAQRLKLAFGVDFVDLDNGEEDDDRAEMLASILVYPVEVPLFVSIGGGAFKGSSGGQFIVSAGVGYEFNLSRLWYLSLLTEQNWAKDGRRNVVLFGIGKRF